MKRTVFLASASSVAMAGVAGAADLAVRPAAVPVYAPTWSGFYLGANAGILTHYNTVQDLSNWTDINYVNNVQSKNTSGTVGGQIGYNVQDGNFVYGIEADWDWADARGDKSIYGCPGCFGGPLSSTTQRAQIHSELDSLATIRGRAGLAVGSTLAYVTAGLAIAETNNHWGSGYTGPTPGCRNCGPTNDTNFSQSRTQYGWVAGVGIEHMFLSLPQWTFKLEALWADLGKSSVTNPGISFVTGRAGPFVSEFQNQAATARVGVNYKFGVPAAAVYR